MRYSFIPIIDPEFKSLIPPLSDEEFRQLEENILEVGECREPLVTWNKILLDGHNRWKIIQKHPGEIDYECTEMVFDSRNEAMAWMIRNQLGRRNLPNYERARLALRLKEAVAAEAKEKQREAGGAVRQKSDKAAVDTKKELAKVAGVSHDTIHKVDVIEQKAPEEVKAQLRRGEVSINKAYNEVCNPRKLSAAQKILERDKRTTDINAIVEYGVEDLLEDIRVLKDEFINKFQKVMDVRRDVATDNAEAVLEFMNEFESEWTEIKEIFK